MGNDKTEGMTILISSPESYRDVFNISADLFLKNWSDCPFEKVYATDNMNGEGLYKGFTIQRFPDALDWISRTKKVMQYINNKYIMVIADDLFVVNSISTSAVVDLLKYIDQNDILFCRLYNSKSFRQKNNLIGKDIYSIKYNQPYGRNLLGAIWEKSFFIKFLNDALSDPWTIEEKWLKEGITKGNSLIEHHCYFDNNFFYHAVYKGMWMRNAKQVIQKQGVDFVSKRKRISLKKSILVSSKSFFRERLSAKCRARLKRILYRFVHFDTRY